MERKIGKIGKKTKIIDRTLPELFCSNPDISRLELLNMSWMLRILGADFLEMDLRIVKRLGKLPADFHYLYRIDSEAAQEGLSSHPFREIVISRDMPEFRGLLDHLGTQCKEVAVECKVETVEDLLRLHELKDAGWFRYVGTIRLTGLNCFTSACWLKIINGVKRALKVNMDICPENLYYNATASAVDGILNGADYVTTSFTGYGGASGYAATEQVLAYAKAVLKQDSRIQLNILPELTESFSRVSGVKIPESMPVIGKSIFVYESGIHADGIGKNPMTYEPYDPGMVGMERKLSIGKHSGGNSVAKKLRELGIEAGKVQVSDFLKQIRKKSISLRRNLRDDEILALLKPQPESEPRRISGEGARRNPPRKECMDAEGILQGLP